MRRIAFWAFYAVVLGSAALGFGPFRELVRVVPVVLIGPPVVLIVWPLIARRWNRPMPDAPEQTRRADALHVVVTPVLIVSGTVPVALAAFAVERWVPTASSLSSTSFAVQLLVAFVAMDFAGYWAHRALHGVEVGWRFHRVHHSSTHFHWMADARFHPFEGIWGGACNLIPVVLLGISPEAAIGVAVIQKTAATLFHANVPLHKIPLVDQIFVTPRFHRFHHGDRPDCYDTNFGLVLAIWDTMFGTRGMPNTLPDRFGIRNAPEERWVEHMLEPLRWR